MEDGRMWRNFAEDKTCYILIELVGIGCVYMSKINKLSHKIGVYFIVYKLYLKKVDFENTCCIFSLICSLAFLDDLRS